MPRHKEFPSNVDPFKVLEKKSSKMHEPNKPTGDLITHLLNVIDGISGDNPNEDPDHLFVRERCDLAEVQEVAGALLYTGNQLREFLTKGSRQALLKYFTEEQLEKPDFLAVSLTGLSSFVEKGDMIISATEANGPIPLFILEDFVNTFRFSLAPLEEQSHGDGAILSEIIMNDDLLADEKTERQKKVDLIREDLINFNSHFFRRMFIENDNPQSPVGDDMVREATLFIPGLSERMAILSTLSLSDIEHLQIEEEDKKRLLVNISNHVESVKRYLQKFGDNSQLPILARQKIDESELKWMNNVIGPLGQLVAQVVAEEDITW